MGLGPGDLIAIPAFTFAAVINAVWSIKAVPVVVDCEPDSWNMDLSQCADLATRCQGAVLVHTFGSAIQSKAIDHLMSHTSLRLVEDACEALGTRVTNRFAGTTGPCGVFGFYPNKPITSGEGGMVICSNETLAHEIRVRRNQGRDGSSGFNDHCLHGTSARLSELHAALGRSQLARIEALLAQRSRIANWYQSALAHQPGLRFPAIGPTDRRAWFTFPVLVESGAKQRNALMAQLRAQGIQTGRYFPSVHQQPAFRRMGGIVPTQPENAERLSQSCLCLPLYPQLRKRDVQRICAALSKAMGSHDGALSSETLARRELDNT